MSRKLAPLVLGAAALILVSVATGSTGANTVKLSAVLTVDKDVPPAKRPPAGAIGHFTATLTGSTLRWTLTYKGLTGAATESHIHGGQRGPERFQAVVAPLCGSYLNYGLPCRSGMTRTAKLDARSIALIKALSAFAFDASTAPSARTVTLAVTYSFAGQYTNTQQLDEKSCNVRLTETVDYRGWQRFSALRLPLSGNASASSKERLRLLTGKWRMRGAYYPGNNCRDRLEQLDCTGAVRFNAHGPRHGLVRAQVRGGAVVISVATGYADIFESDTYAIDPTVGSSTPAACLAPLSPYLGLRDATAPLMRVVAKTSSARLAKLRPGQNLVLTLTPIDAARTGAVRTCNGRGGCTGRMQHGERLTIVLTG